MDDQITLIMCHKVNKHDKDGPNFINNLNTEWNSLKSFYFDTKITFTSEWHNRGKEADKTEISGLGGQGLCREDFNFHNIREQSDIIGILSSEDCCIEFTFYAKHDNIVKKKVAIDGEEAISITLNDVHDCSINIEYKHSSMSGTLSEFDSTEIIPVSVAEKILHTNSIDEVLKIIKENKKYA